MGDIRRAFDHVRSTFRVAPNYSKEREVEMIGKSSRGPWGWFPIYYALKDYKLVRVKDGFRDYSYYEVGRFLENNPHARGVITGVIDAGARHAVAFTENALIESFEHVAYQKDERHLEWIFPGNILEVFLLIKVKNKKKKAFHRQKENWIRKLRSGQLCLKF